MPETGLNKILRIIDANTNRIGEGLRLLEDIARLMLDDAALSARLKALRHSLEISDITVKKELLQARDSIGDVGIDIETPDQLKDRNVIQAAIAGARRVEQSLRVLEDLAKLPDANLDPEKLKTARFEMYTIERQLISLLLRHEAAARICGLYAVVDTECLAGKDPVEAARQLIEGGAKIIQLRGKTTPKKALLPLAIEMKRLCAARGVLFIMNDYPDIALATDADGLHIGQDDLPVAAARKLMPIDKLIGCSVATADQALAAESEGADYIAVAAIYPTATRQNTGVVGLEGLRLIHSCVKVPVVAIGGITPENAGDVLAAGADSIAVISAILRADSISRMTRLFADICHKRSEDIGKSG
jgi:thiamine-phosphate pyrophosphorylase